ncbi:MAG TPA: VOC family protein [Thermoanaerobaculia bacterium]|nr:VOC family protein [Thermoanaerobaculia bacterium]
MKLLHVALVRSSEAASDRFFQGLLDLEKRRTKTASAELCAGLFGIAEEHRMVDYGNEHLLFEVFLSTRQDLAAPHIGHVCLEVEDLGGLLSRCAAFGVEVRQVARGDGSAVTFLADGDGNLFEIKQRA